MKKGLFILTFLLPLLSACLKPYDSTADQELVVEGWIDADGAPFVIVTASLPLSEEMTPVSSLSDYIVKWAKVTVSDGEESVVLTGKRSSKHFPPYIYTTSRISGKAGGIYSLKVEYSGVTATARTTIPQPLDLDKIQAVPIAGKDSLYSIVCGFTPPPGSDCSYRFFAKVEGVDSSFVSCLTEQRSSIIPGQYNEVSLTSINSISRPTISPAFKSGMTVRILFRTVDHDSASFWNSFDEIASIIGSPLFPASDNPQSNIDGALGYWAGYGTREYVIEIP